MSILFPEEGPLKSLRDLKEKFPHHFMSNFPEHINSHLYVI